MRRTWLSVLCTTLLALLATPALAALKVVATVPDLAALARAVGGERVEVTALALPTQDPHFVDAKPSLALELNRADLLLAIGLGLESGWLPTLQTGARNPRILAGSPGYWEASSAVRLLDVPEAPVDRSAGDIHPGGNPHFLYDPRAALAVAKALAARLAQVDPAGASAYQANLARFTTELEAARAKWEQQLASLRGQPVVAYHKSIAYLADWLGMQPIAFIEPKPGIPPNPSHIAHLLVLGRQNKVRVLVQEEYYPDATSKLVAQQIPTALVKVPGGPDFQAGQSYVDYIERMVTLLEQAVNAGPR
jgi:zinc/manganese transport system substrate-binding protein